MPFPKLNSAKLDSLKRNINRFLDQIWNGLFHCNLLRVTCFAGLILSVLIGGTLLAFYFLGGGNPQNAGREDSFYRMLRDYDRVVQGAEFSDGTMEIEKLDRELDKLEKKAEGVESWLSVLKRRRHLARLAPRYAAAYRQSARRAAQEYPWSQPLAAVAAAALVQDAAITREAEAELRARLLLLTDASFSSLKLGLHILAGDFKNPETAADLGGISSAGLHGLSFPEMQSLAADLAIIKLLKGDHSAAAAEIQSILSGYTGDWSPGALLPPVTNEFLRFAAEYNYDFGDILRSAELFSKLPDDAALLRQADALWLAGYAESARSIWSMADNARSLYNRAITAPDQREAAALLERLITLPDSNAGAGGSAAAGDLCRQYGLIRYSRRLAAAGAIAILESGGNEKSPAYPIIDLEKLRRYAETWELGRLVAETWLLLERHPDNEDLYRWAAWFFDYQRYYGETAMLLRNAARQQFRGQWTNLYTAIQQIRDGNLDAAEEILRNTESADWPAAANLGRILEVRRSPARALEYYEIAAAGVQNPKNASRIQLRIALCLNALGRDGEVRRVLEYALDLNPDNLNARLELSRMEQ